MNAIFRRFAERASTIVGTPWAFIVAITVIAGWAVCGPIFGFSEHWQLIINSFTTIVTFLMVFIIQNTQNRDFKTIQLKLDSLVNASDGTPRIMLNLNSLTDKELDRLAGAFQRAAPRGGIDTAVRQIERHATEVGRG